MKSVRNATPVVATPTKPASTTTTKKVSRTEALNFIKSLGGQFMTITFTKKGGEECTLNGRLKVSKGVKGTGKVDAGSMGYLRLYTNKENKWRNVDTRTISCVKGNKQCIIVNK